VKARERSEQFCLGVVSCSCVLVSVRSAGSCWVRSLLFDCCFLHWAWKSSVWRNLQKDNRKCFRKRKPPTTTVMSYGFKRGRGNKQKNPFDLMWVEVYNEISSRELLVVNHALSFFWQAKTIDSPCRWATFPRLNEEHRWRRSSSFSDNPRPVAFDGDCPHLQKNQSSWLTAIPSNSDYLHQIHYRDRFWLFWCGYLP